MSDTAIEDDYEVDLKLVMEAESFLQNMTESVNHWVTFWKLISREAIVTFLSVFLFLSESIISLRQAN